MAIEPIRIFSAANLTNGSGGQAIRPGDTNGNLSGDGPFSVGGGTGTIVGIDDTDTGRRGDTEFNFDDGTRANQVLNADLTLTYNDGSGEVTNTFPTGSQVQAEFAVTFSSGFTIIGVRLENPDGPPNLITAGYTFVDASGNPTVPPPGTNLGSVTNVQGNGTSSYGNVACFTPGCIIDTPTGGRPVEDLKVGDLVLTADNGPRPIRWTGRRYLDAATLAANPNLHPIRIGTGALARNVPARDLIVSPQHRILVRSRIAIRMFDADEVFLPARQLLGVDGVEIAADLTSVIYLHFICDAHEIVRAEGALTETLHTGSEAMKAMGSYARAEIDAIFGGAADLDRPIARPVPGRRQASRFVERHVKNGKALYSAEL
ncbi:Hint domain-containing protein [Jannaschia sp. S6380]|uniref:Hint domain-containing protein n=1 Tax=Jannaschia sp. S6380 TaxID=2926408 RepID=UPI001FF4C3EC|nr:Hint domain-containing protein [Jannaschia sp. S6380]MCK0169083.1 Hint domain-containing protein [Jannaschia sp. S6380]